MPVTIHHSDKALMFAFLPGGSLFDNVVFGKALQKVCKALVRSEGRMTHYSKGSEKPPLKGDVLRLYSMRFCPFAQVGFVNRKLSFAMGKVMLPLWVGEGVF